MQKLWEEDNKFSSFGGNFGPLIRCITFLFGICYFLGCNTKGFICLDWARCSCKFDVSISVILCANLYYALTKMLNIIVFWHEIRSWVPFLTM